MRRVYIKFAHVSGWDFGRYWTAENFPIVTAGHFEIQREIRAIPAMKIINAYGLDAHDDTESDWEDRVHIIVENVPEEVLILLKLALAPGDLLEAW